MKKKGISLILLVITIIIIIIIASAVILNLNNNNPVDKARLANVESTRDSLKSGINLYIGKIMLDENGNHRAQTMILGKNEEVEKYKIITGDFREDYETIFTNKQIWQLDYNRVNSLVNIKLDIYDSNSRWYIDEYGNPYLVYDKLSNVAPYLKNEEGTDILSSVKDFVVYLDKDIEFSENTQPEPAENITSSIVINKNSNSTATISGFSRNGIKSITYTGPRQGTITPTMNGNYYTAVANVGNGDYTFTVTDNNDEILTKEETISGITSFTVGSVEDLCRFRDYVNMGDDFAGVTVTQLADLDLSSVCSGSLGSFTPIGISNDYYFSGIYDGQNYEINNLYIYESNKDNVGLFGRTHGCKIRNVIVSGSVSGIGGFDVAGICGYAKSETEIYNCISNVNVLGENCVGGICGFGRDKFSIKNCVNNATINGSDSSSGGILGASHETYECIITDCTNTGEVTTTNYYAGGIVGYTDYGTTISVEKCKNTGNIVATRQSSGGIIGGIRDAIGVVDKCCNFGNITTTNNYCAGGCVGNILDGGKASISNCYNKGTITTGKGSLAGILGNMDLNDTSYSAPSATVTNCYNAGIITQKGTYGGILGWTKNTSWYTLTNNYWETGKGASYGVGTGSSNVGATGVSSNTLKGYASTLGSAYTADTTNINDGYPILAWQ